MLSSFKKRVHKVRSLLRSKGVILMYHRIADVENDPWDLAVKPDLFKQHLEVLSQFDEVLPLQDLSESITRKNRRNKAIALTFDDGYRDNYYEAQKWLLHYNIPATFFIASGYINSNREFWWDELERLLLTPGQLPKLFHLKNKGFKWDLGEDDVLLKEDYIKFKTWKVGKQIPTKRHSLYLKLWEIISRCSHEEQVNIMSYVSEWAGLNKPKRNSYLPLTREELVRLSRCDIIDIGGHTCHHPKLSELPIATQRKELFDCKKSLETWIGKGVSTFSYPHGDYNQDTLKLIKEAGFQFAYTTKGQIADDKQPAYLLPRLQVKNWNGEEFEQILCKWLTK